MSELYERIVSQRHGLERIVARIPGFRGYKDAQARRDADRMVREHIVRLLKEQLQRFAGLEKRMLTSGGLAFMSQSANAKMIMQTFIDRINTAAPGYSGFYSAKKVGTEEFEKLYAFDAALVEYADRFDEKIDALEAALAAGGAAIGAAIMDIETLARDANSAMSLRDDVVTGLAQDTSDQIDHLQDPLR
jgi:hypothetical protein